MDFYLKLDRYRRVFDLDFWLTAKLVDFNLWQTWSFTHVISEWNFSVTVPQEFSVETFCIAFRKIFPHFAIELLPNVTSFGPYVSTVLVPELLKFRSYSENFDVNINHPGIWGHQQYSTNIFLWEISCDNQHWFFMNFTSVVALLNNKLLLILSHIVWRNDYLVHLHSRRWSNVFGDARF